MGVYGQRLFSFFDAEFVLFFITGKVYLEDAGKRVYYIFPPPRGMSLAVGRV